MPRSAGRAAAAVTVLGLLAAGLGSCMHSSKLVGPEIKASLVLRFRPQFDPILVNTLASQNLTRVDWDIRWGADRQILSQNQTDLDADILEEPIVIEVKLSVDEGDLEPEGHIRLLGEGQTVEWSGLFGPVAVNTRQEVWTINVPMGRGDLVNLSVQSIAVSGLENGLVEGETGTLTAVTDGAQGTVVFWGSRNPGIATVDAQGRVQALNPGEVTIVAVAGMRADSVVVQVHPGSQ